MDQELFDISISVKDLINSFSKPALEGCDSGIMFATACMGIFKHMILFSNVQAIIILAVLCTIGVMPSAEPCLLSSWRWMQMKMLACDCRAGAEGLE